jgi:hypothetical protein
MNYGGHYRNTPANLARQARAEDLDVVHDLIVNKEERIPDIAWFRPDADPASTPQVTILHAQEYHTSFWGHLGLLHLADHVLTPDFAAYRHTAMASPYPHNGVIADLAHAQGGLVGYVHPYDARIVPAQEKSLSHALPADVIAGKVDYLEVVGFSDHKATAEVWYRLLNLGFRLPAGAGTDAMANYASLRGPVGLNRVFLDTGGGRDPDSLKAALKAGHGFVSNAPLLGFMLDGAKPGASLPRSARNSLAYRVALRSPVPVDHLELVQNGRVVKAFALRGERRTLDVAGEVRLERGGWWCCGRGTTQRIRWCWISSTATGRSIWPSPHRGGRGRRTRLLRHVDGSRGRGRSRGDYNDAREKNASLDYLRQARDGYRILAAGAAVDAKESGK